MSYDAFLSHSSRDKAIADRMCQYLELHLEKLAAHLQFLAGEEGPPFAAMAERSAPQPARSEPLHRPVCRRRMIVAVSLALAILVGGIAFLYLPFRGGLGPPLQTRSEEPLQGSVDVLVWNPQDELRRGISIRHAAARPTHPADLVQVKVAVNRPAYVYLLWIGEDGKVVPVYPWRPGDWRNRPATDRPVESLRLPAELDRGWPMGAEEGMETMILLARDTPLRSSFDLDRATAGLHPQKTQSPQALVEFEGGRIVTESMAPSRAPQFFDTQRINDPVFQNHETLTERLGHEFRVISAVSFASHGNYSATASSHDDVSGGSEGEIRGTPQSVDRSRMSLVWGRSACHAFLPHPASATCKRVHWGPLMLK